MTPEEAQEVKATFANIVRFIQQNQPDQAEKLATDALTRFPNEPNFLRVQGVALMRQGKVEEALKPLSNSVRIAPQLASGHEQYAMVLGALGRLQDAENSFQTALKLDPNLAAVYPKLARVQAMMGKSDEAKKSWDRLFELNPNFAQMQEAMTLQREGKTDEARKMLKDLLRADPDNINALNLMGAVCLGQKAFNDAEAFLRRAVELADDFSVAWGNLGIALKEQQKGDEAVEVLEKAVRLDPMNAEWHNILGATLMTMGKEDESLACFKRAIEIKPDHFGALMSTGHVLKTLGKQEEAIRAYRQSAAVQPDYGEIYWSMANLKTFRFEPEEVTHMKDQIKSGRLEDESEVNFCFSLGKHFEDNKDYEKAFDYYARGNAKQRKLVQFDPVEFSIAADNVISVFTKEFFAEREGYGHDDASPILVVGLPRSGSTLVEQILSSHSQVDGTGELSDLLRICQQVGMNRADGLRYPHTLIDMPENLIKELGKDYISDTFYHRQGAPHFIDKMPNNFPHIGFLHLILPNAKVIDARRHPLDSCFGTFKQLFAKGQTFSYDLFDLAEYYKTYIRLMEHWDEVLPGKVLRVQYEDNVADQESQARRMIEHCGLEWEDQVLRFYETDRAVKTASSEQVRQPIYTGSLNTWKRYEKQLADLILDLEPVLEKLPPHIERPAIPS